MCKVPPSCDTQAANWNGGGEEGEIVSKIGVIDVLVLNHVIVSICEFVCCMLRVNCDQFSRFSVFHCVVLCTAFYTSSIVLSCIENPIIPIASSPNFLISNLYQN